MMIGWFALTVGRKMQSFHYIVGDCCWGSQVDSYVEVQRTVSDFLGGGLGNEAEAGGGTCRTLV